MTCHSDIILAEFGFRSLSLFWLLVSSFCTVISFMMPLSVSFLETQGLRRLMGDACSNELIGRHLFPADAATMSQGMCHKVRLRGDCFLPDKTCPILFLLNFWGLAILKKLNTEMCFNHTEFSIVMFIFRFYLRTVFVTYTFHSWFITSCSTFRLIKAFIKKVFLSMSHSLHTAYALKEKLSW